MTGPIVAIGGGEIGAGETRSIDEYVIDQAPGNQTLFVPTASGDSEEYIEKFRRYYGEDLGCQIATLEMNNDADPDTAREKIDAADVIYIGGGDTGHFVDTVRTLGLRDALANHREEGGVLTGLSAGALCWFRAGLSDAVALPDVDYGPVTGFDFIPDLMATVHADFRRRERFLRFLTQREATGVALGDCAAIEFTGNAEFRVLTSSPNGFAYHMDPSLADPVTVLSETDSPAPLAALR